MGSLGPNIHLVASDDQLRAALAAFADRPSAGGCCIIPTQAFPLTGPVYLDRVGVTVRGLARVAIEASGHGHFVVKADDVTVENLELVGGSGYAAMTIDGAFSRTRLLDVYAPDADHLVAATSNDIVSQGVLRGCHGKSVQCCFHGSEVVGNTLETLVATALSGLSRFVGNSVSTTAAGPSLDTTAGSGSNVVGENIIYDTNSPGSGTSLATHASDSVGTNEV